MTLRRWVSTTPAMMIGRRGGVKRRRVAAGATKPSWVAVVVAVIVVATRVVTTTSTNDEAISRLQQGGNKDNFLGRCLSACRSSWSSSSLYTKQANKFRPLWNNSSTSVVAQAADISAIEWVGCSAACRDQLVSLGITLLEPPHNQDQFSTFPLRESRPTKSLPPHSKLKYRELYEAYKCDDDATYYSPVEGTVRDGSAQQRPIPSHGTWLYLRDVFNAVVRANLCRDGENDPLRWDGTHRQQHFGSGAGAAGAATPWCYVEGVDTGLIDFRLPSTISSSSSSSSALVRNQTRPGSGFLVPVEIRYSPGKGRGVFATQFIEEGQVVWVSWYEGWMKSGILYRQLLDALPTNALKCDLMAFTYFTSSGGTSSSGGGADDHEEDEEGKVDDGADGSSSVSARDGDIEDDSWFYDEGAASEVGEEDEATVGAYFYSGHVQTTTSGRDALEVPDDEVLDVPTYASRKDSFVAIEDAEGKSGPSSDEGTIESVTETYMDKEEEMDNAAEEPRTLLEPAHPEGEPDTRRRYIIVALDEAAVMNADWESPTHEHNDDDDDDSYYEEMRNVNVGPRENFDEEAGPEEREAVKEGWSVYVALRDIHEDEEIICDYHNFAFDDEGWARFGL